MSLIRTDTDGTEYADLTIYTPAFISGMRHFAEMYKAAGYEEGTLWGGISSLSDQSSVSTATEAAALALWAAVYGASVSGNLETTRAAILDRMQPAQTCTPALIEETALELTGAAATVTESYADYTFTVTFTGCYGEPYGVDLFIQRLELIKPAHLAYTIEYTYATWADAAAVTWGTASAYTWAGMKGGNFVG